MNEADKLTKTVNSFCEYMRSLPEEQTRQQSWSVVYHHELYVRLAEACLAKVNGIASARSL